MQLLTLVVQSPDADQRERTEQRELMLRDLLAEVREDVKVAPRAFLLETLVPNGGE